MPIAIAKQSIDEMRELPLSLRPVLDSLSRALTIGLAHQLPTYDSLYISLAESLGCPLLTADTRQATVAELIGVTVKPITDFPEFTEQQ